MRHWQVQEDEVRLVGLQHLRRVLLEVDVGPGALPHLVAAQLALLTLWCHNLFAQLPQWLIDVLPEARSLHHAAVGQVEVHPIAVVDGAGIEGAVRVVPAHRCRPPTLPLRIGEDRPCSIQPMKSMLPQVMHLQAVVEGETVVVDRMAAQQRRQYVHRSFPNRLRIAKDGALTAQSVEVRQRKAARAMPIHLIVGELIEDHPHQQRMLPWRLRCRLPRGCLLMRPRPPARHAQHLYYAAEREDGQKVPGKVPHLHQPPIAVVKPEQKQQHDRCPYHRQHDQPADRQVKRK